MLPAELKIHVCHRSVNMHVLFYFLVFFCTGCFAFCWVLPLPGQIGNGMWRKGMSCTHLVLVLIVFFFFVFACFFLSHVLRESFSHFFLLLYAIVVLSFAFHHLSNQFHHTRILVQRGALLLARGQDVVVLFACCDECGKR